MIVLHCITQSLQWRHNERDGVSNHQPHDYLLNRLFRYRSKKTSASLAFVRGIHRWPVKFPVQMASNAENVSIWWRHHVNSCWEIFRRFLFSILEAIKPIFAGNTLPLFFYFISESTLVCIYICRYIYVNTHTYTYNVLVCVGKMTPRYSLRILIWDWQFILVIMDFLLGDTC